MSEDTSNSVYKLISDNLQLVETFAPLFHSNSHINQMPPQIIHILRFFWYTQCPDFVTNWIEVKAVRRQEILKFIQVSYIIALSDLTQHCYMFCCLLAYRGNNKPCMYVN